MRGDRNTNFFHQKTLSRRRRNRITTIMDDSDYWLYNTEAIKQHAICFFSSLYTNDDSCFRSYPHRGFFPNIEASTRQSLRLLVEDNEIRQSIFSMKPLKAPGVDGYPAVFYQSQWHLVGESICRLVKEVFSSGRVPNDINRMLLVLIFKVDNPMNLKLYRPTSLHTVPHKIITKLIANRLKAILRDLISPQQTSFVLGRHIIENIVVAQVRNSYNEEKCWKCGANGY